MDYKGQVRELGIFGEMWDIWKSWDSQPESFFRNLESFLENIESFFKKVESFFDKVETFFEKIETFFEKLESFFEKVESFFEICWEFWKTESSLLAVTKVVKTVNSRKKNNRFKIIREIKSGFRVISCYYNKILGKK